MLQFDYDIEDFMSYCQSQNIRPKTINHIKTLKVTSILRKHCMNNFNGIIDAFSDNPVLFAPMG